MSALTSPLLTSLRRLKHWSAARRRPSQPEAGTLVLAPGADSAVVEHYALAAPADRNALDIFRGEWASRLPGDRAGLTAGQSRLFEDDRIDWMIAELGGVEGWRVLELGPLEAGHTYMLQQRGAASVLSVEANVRAYLKCLVIKEILGLTRARFLCGNFVEYLRQCRDRFDLCLASGVLYHMDRPAELIALAGRASDRLFLWTHYVDEAALARDPELARRFSGRHDADHEGFRHTLFRHEYGASRRLAAFWGGGAAHSHWMTRADILGCLRHFGFSDLRVHFEDPHHPNGPAFAVLARRPTVDGRK